jgi:nucleotide-binding universal stress UspA family protein
MKKIIVPTDFSQHAEYALKVAASLAKKHNAAIAALHMLPMPDTFLTADEGSHREEAVFFMKMAHKRFQQFLDKDYLEGLQVEEVVQQHPDFTHIIDKAHEQNADIIIMGSHGATGFKGTFIGSNAEKVVRSSDIPVLVIKEETEDFDIKNLVYACDLKPESKNAFIKAYNFAQSLDAQMHLLYVNTPGERFKSSSEITAKLGEFIENLKTIIDVNKIIIHIYNDYYVEGGIINLSKTLDKVLIGLATHGRSGIAHFFRGSISEDMVNHARKPVITFKI